MMMALRLSKAAEVLGISKATVRRWIDRGLLALAKDDLGKPLSPPLVPMWSINKRLGGPQ